MKTCLMGLLLALTAFHVAAQAPRLSPEMTGQAFYSWYLGAMNKDESPIDEHDPKLNQYVTQHLINRIQVLIKSPTGMNNDYFIQGPDYSDSWVDHISTLPFEIHGDEAKGEVVLGLPDDQQRLLLTMKDEHGIWKIDDVSTVTPP
ncbi:hypothetical protein BL250_13275 [Erwinia sp. OLTSP20]|uniref:DUF3828 domain-containing protein n=1 Tax=unclassified Erwinia TaxID=2622719 RepID=UPI000C199EFB|nr:MULTISPECIES: DUF3828 domain-containing protein [unclassified Erwinia]PIJ50391.1 hypothetical protein BV501_08840 [Erwinia sp. OAMSP11]PIJ71650.1 hypothetical protein BK416_11220 [Erwinia sp. OLSSP12]PIJ81034.1 hypothetical protein BLD47_10080 [Erwinia sp. OLCASP19]PIJ83292.1 hypothetical protein BLD46_10080 [Erwinia sp. OLMTSP26]PIJ85972.1 hypothetical protein BLD49_09385 [Erwinia sp. OLMDSP33]